MVEANSDQENGVVDKLLFFFFKLILFSQAN